MLRSPTHKQAGASGFTLLEVLVAVVVLAVGLMSMAMLAARMLAGGRQSKYMSMAPTLASAKLEDLNRWNSDNPQLCVPTGSSSVGSLTADILQTTTCPGGSSASVNYYDDVSTSVTNTTGDCPNGTTGCFAETTSAVNGGNTVYTTTYHSPDGTITQTTSATAPASSTFHRRWIIESNPVIGGSAVNGLRRVTVLVTLSDATVQPTVTFQMSMVRQ